MQVPSTRAGNAQGNLRGSRVSRSRDTLQRFTALRASQLLIERARRWREAWSSYLRDALSVHAEPLDLPVARGDGLDEAVRDGVRAHALDHVEALGAVGLAQRLVGLLPARIKDESPNSSAGQYGSVDRVKGASEYIITHLSRPLKRLNRSSKSRASSCTDTRSNEDRLSTAVLGRARASDPPLRSPYLARELQPLVAVVVLVVEL